MENNESWRTIPYRLSVASKIDVEIQQLTVWSGRKPTRSCFEIEQRQFQKAKNKEEYLTSVARIILYMRNKIQDEYGVQSLMNNLEKLTVETNNNPFLKSEQQQPSESNLLQNPHCSCCNDQSVNGTLQGLQSCVNNITQPNRGLMQNQMHSDDSWKTTAFRHAVVTKIEEEIKQVGATSNNTLEIENNVFQKAKNKQEYLEICSTADTTYS
ncbi:uncharacterized protein LOC135130033 isoform X2 [Zophobas morio]